MYKSGRLKENQRHSQRRADRAQAVQVRVGWATQSGKATINADTGRKEASNRRQWTRRLTEGEREVALGHKCMYVRRIETCLQRKGAKHGEENGHAIRHVAGVMPQILQRAEQRLEV